MTDAELTAKMIADECEGLDWNDTDHRRRVMKFSDIKVDSQAFLRAMQSRGYNAEFAKGQWDDKPYWLLKITKEN